MKSCVALFILLCSQGALTKDVFGSLDHLKPRSSVETQTKAVQDLIQRYIGEKASFFFVTIDPTLSTTNDAFKLEKVANYGIHITGTSGVAASAGFNHYLKYYCNCHISWESSQLNLPEILPDVNITITLNDRFRYYQNVCTTSYSFVWWNWEQWEKHIDWMALNGFNLVLAFNGQEAIWDRVYRNFNLTAGEISEHFAGPAFLSWLRMGNIRGFGGPLSDAWHSRSIVLQKQILQQMRSFGITAVLPAFAGHLPRAFKRLYPDAKMTEVEPWNHFTSEYCCPYFLDPTEPLFNEIGQAFLTEMIAEFGTDHVYNCDSFNENTPSSGDLVYLFNVGSSIYKAMTDVDPDAIWMLQGWMFYYDSFWNDTTRVEALLTSVSLGKMIVLDLQSEQWPQYERLPNYFGQPYIWCMLHDFGGTLGMFGSSTIINEEPIKARNAANSTMVGTGLTPEGINQNYIIYDLMTETAWRNTPSNLTEWFGNYTIRRYGADDENAKEAWIILQGTVYNFSSLVQMRGKYVITKSPSLTISTWHWYSPDSVYEAWSYLGKSSQNLGNNAGFLHDLVDVTRQVLQLTADAYYQLMLAHYNNKDLALFQEASEMFLEIFTDLESVLASNQDFLLGPWLESAKAAASSSDEEVQFEYNARNQITLWGPNGEILDYANKQWSGVVSSYFGPRWTLFVSYLNETLQTGAAFNQSFISNKIFKEVEEPFTFDRSLFRVEPTGDTVDIVQALYKKWTLDDFKKVTKEVKQRTVRKSVGNRRKLRRKKDRNVFVNPLLAYSLQ